MKIVSIFERVMRRVWCLWAAVVCWQLVSAQDWSVSVAREVAVAGRTFPVWWRAPISNDRTAQTFIAFTPSLQSCPYNASRETAVIGTAATSGYVELVLGSNRPAAYNDGRVVLVIIWPTPESWNIQCGGKNYVYYANTYVQLVSDFIITGGPGYAAFFSSSFALSQQEQRSINRLQTSWPDFNSLAVWAVGDCDAESFSGIKSWTSEFWFKTSARTNWPEEKKALIVPVLSQLKGDQAVFEIAIDGRDGSLVFKTSSLFGVCKESRTTSGTDYSLIAEKWTHISAVYDDVTKHKLLYINGELAQRWNCSSSLTPFSVGTKRIQLGKDYYDGWIDEVRLWSSARSQTQIRNAMNRTLYADEASVVQAYYNFDKPAEESLNIVYDESGKDRHLKLGLEPLFVSGYNTARKRRKPQIRASDNVFLYGSNLILEAPAWNDYEPSSVLIPLKSSSSSSQKANFTIMFFDPAQISLRIDNVQVFTFPATFTGKLTASINFGFFGTSSLWIRAGPSSPAFDVKIIVKSNSPPLAGNGGGMLFCDGIDDFAYSKDLSLGQTGISPAKRQLTVEFWAYFLESSQVGSFFSFGNEEVRGNWCGNLAYCSGRITASTEYVSIGWNNDGNGTISFDYKLERFWGDWNHYAITSDGEFLKIFVNGELFKSTTAGIWRENVLGFYLCHWPYYGSNTHLFKGFLDEVRIWNRSLSSAELYASLRTKPSSYSGIVAYWNFDETFSTQPKGTSNVVKDISGNGYDLILGGCTPPTYLYCDELNCPSNNTFHQRPCWGNAVKESSIPELIESFAPIGVTQAVSIGDMNSDLVLSLASSDLDAVNAKSILSFQLTRLPSKGELRDSNNALITSTPYNLLYLPLKFSPYPTEGGRSYASLEFTVFDGAQFSDPVEMQIAIRCAPGHKLDEDLKICLPCSPGRFSNQTSFEEDCMTVPQNFYAPRFGSVEITPCLLGSAVEDDGSSCKQCPPGKFGEKNILTGQFYCEVCNSTTYQDERGQTTCKICPADYKPVYRPNGAVVCGSIAQLFGVRKVTASIGAPFYVCIAILGFGILASSWFFWNHRQAKLILAVSVPLTFTSAFGCIVLLIASILYLVPGGIHLCQSRFWFLNIGATLAYQPLFMKLYRLLRIFGQKKSLKVIAMNNYVIFGIILGILMFNISILTAWSVVYPSVVVPDEEGGCEEAGALSFGMVLVVEKLLFLLWGFYLSHKMRHIPITYNDAQHLGFMCSIMLVWFIFVVIIFLSRTVFTLVLGNMALSSLCLLLVANILCLVFLPRIMKCIREPKSSETWRKKLDEYSEISQKSGVTSTFPGTVREKSGKSNEGSDNFGGDEDSHHSSFADIQKECLKVMQEMEKVESKLRYRVRSLEEKQELVASIHENLYRMHLENCYQKASSARREQRAEPAMIPQGKGVELHLLK